jgi:Ca2+-binding RTX toxin-like protein
VIAVIGAAGVALLVASPAAAKPGDLIVGASFEAGVVRVDPATGTITTISDDADFSAPSGTTFAPNGDLFVADYNVGVLRIPKGSSAATEIAGFPTVEQAVFVHYHPDGFLYQPDFLADDTPVFRISTSGSVTPFVDDEPLLPAPFGVEVGHSGALYVSDLGGRIVEIDPKTRAVSTVATVGVDLYGLGLTPKGRLLVADQDDDRIVEVNPKTGAQRTLADDLPSAPYEAAEAPNGKLYVIGDEITEINPKTGSRRLVANQSGEGLEIEPPKCKGKLATIVGSTKKDKLKGSKFADVIHTLGGKDRVNAKRGKDIVCGGKGKDKLKGGGGRDKLFGQGGRDKLDGGAGRDIERQ